MVSSSPSFRNAAAVANREFRAELIASPYIAGHEAIVNKIEIFARNMGFESLNKVHFCLRLHQI